MAKKTFYVEIDSAEKLKAFDALLIILGFEKKSPTEYVEKPKAVKKAVAKTPKRLSATTKAKAVKRTTAKK